MGSIRLHPSLGMKVLERLREYADLPSRGVVAGQAVASVIDHLQGLAAAPVNDVDIFRAVSAGVLSRKGPTAIYTISAVHASQARPDMDYLALHAFLSRMRSYRISTVSRQGLLNFVNCRLPFVSPLQGLTVARVINSFDLNCVRVGIDLATGELVWDRHYQQFLKTRRIEISCVHTPWHTFLRALKKSTELPNASFDIEAGATVVAAFNESKLYRDFGHNGIVTDEFGPKLVNLAQRFESQWRTYFELDTKVLTGYHNNLDDLVIGTFKLRGSPDVKLQQQVDKMQNSSLHFVGPVIHNVFKKPSHKLVSRVQELEYLLDSSHPVISQQFEQNPWDLAQGHVSAGHLDFVSDFLKDNPEFSDPFAALTLDEQFEAAKALAQAKLSLTLVQFKRLIQFAMPADFRSQASVQALITRLSSDAALPLNDLILPLGSVPAAWAQQGLKVRQLRSLEDFASSPRYDETSAQVWGVRAGSKAVVELSSEEEGKLVTTCLQFAVTDGKPVALTEILRPPGLLAVPRRHSLMSTLIQARVLGSPRGQVCEVTCPEDDLPF